MRKSAIVLAALAAFAAQTLCAYVQVEFTSLPRGANVVLDGKLLGVTPMTLRAPDVTPGKSHHLRIYRKGFEPHDEFFTVNDGENAVKHVELLHEKGILLVTTEPSGAEISLDGYSLGETPRLITSLNAKDQHCLVLRKPGYMERKLDVKFNGRTPVVHNVNLLLDSGVVKIATEPAGAEVTVNGIARGRSPLVVTGVPKGRSTIVMEKQGYATATREISVNPGDEQDLFVALDANPGSLRLTSVPEGARFYIDDVAKGKGPITASNLAPRRYRVRAELDGFGTEERTIDVGIGANLAEEFRLSSILGSMEVRTIPVGAYVYVDGKSFGKTTSDNAGSEASDVMVIPNLKAGEHTLIVKCQGYAEVVSHVQIEVAKATQKNIKMKRVFKPDVRIETSTGVIEGVLISSDATSYLVEVSMGIVRSVSRDVVRSVTPIIDEAK